MAACTTVCIPSPVTREKLSVIYIFISRLWGCVTREFEDYLKCGRLEHEFLRVRCESCHHDVHLTCMDALMPRAHGCAGAAHMLFLDGVYITGFAGGKQVFRRVNAPTKADLEAVLQQLSTRLARMLVKEGVLTLDMENSYLTLDHLEADPSPAGQGRKKRGDH